MFMKLVLVFLLFFIQNSIDGKTQFNHQEKRNNQKINVKKKIRKGILNRAIMQGNIKKVIRLIKDKKYLKEKYRITIKLGKSKYTQSITVRPLHTAALFNRVKIAKILIKKGISVDDFFGYTYTPLHLAVKKGNIKMILFLIKNGANINFINNDAESPLSLASSTNQLEIVQLLIKKGAKVNKKGVYGWTPLHIAALRGHLRIVQFLVKSGADINSKLSSGERALDLAHQQNKKSVVNFLKNYYKKKEK